MTKASIGRRSRQQTGRIPSIKVFKFYSSEVEEFVRAGSIRIGTSVSYRADDGFTDGRSDRSELINHWKPGKSVFPLTHPAFRQFATNMAPEIAAKISVSLEDETQINFARNAAMFCMTKSASISVCKKMLDLFKCDRYFVIPDLRKFTDALRFSDERLLDPIYGEIDYSKRYPETAWHDDLFRKFPQFRWQNEVRLMWSYPDPEPFTVKAPDILDHIDGFFDNPAGFKA